MIVINKEYKTNHHVQTLKVIHGMSCVYETTTSIAFDSTNTHDVHKFKQGLNDLGISYSEVN